MRARQFLPVILAVGLLSTISAVSAQEARPGSVEPTVETTPAKAVDDSAGPSASILLTRQGQRLDLLETDLRDMRGILETDLRNLKMQVTQLGNNAASGESATAAEIRDLRDQVERLADAVAMTSRRMERTLEMNSDMEFRLLRMEKRMQTLMARGGEDLARAAVEDDTIPAGDSGEASVTSDSGSGAVAMTRDVDSGEITWQMSATRLNQQMEANAAGSSAPATGQSTEIASAGALPGDSTAVGGQAPRAEDSADASGSASGATAVAASGSDVTGADTAAAPAGPDILPDASPEEQFMYALQLALIDDRENAEMAFEEFRNLHPSHDRDADALFWIGRIQFINKNFEKAALNFSEFARLYNDDARINDIVGWLAESVAEIAPKEDACSIYAQLPNFMPEPSKKLTDTLARLTAAAECDA